MLITAPIVPMRRKRHGNAQRITGRYAVAHGLQEVPHLVREQNREHRAHVR